MGSGVGRGGGGYREEGVLGSDCNGYEISFWSGEKALELDRCVDCTTL